MEMAVTGANILVVDDDPDHLALTQRWLALAGMQVSTAGSGLDALAEIERRRPDLVVTDLMMENLDGMRLLSEIHRVDAVLPVIFLSGQAEVRDATLRFWILPRPLMSSSAIPSQK